MKTVQITHLDPPTGYADRRTRQSRFTRNDINCSQKETIKNQLRFMETAQIALLDPLTGYVAQHQLQTAERDNQKPTRIDGN